MHWEVALNSMYIYKGSEINLDLRLFGPTFVDGAWIDVMMYVKTRGCPSSDILNVPGTRIVFPKNLLKAQLINPHEIRLSRRS